MTEHRSASLMRHLGALALVAVGIDHIEQYYVDYYRAVPTIGTLEDVVGSTPLVSAIGDDAWGKLFVQRERLVRDCIEDHGGRVIHTAGDGSMCTLPG
ncbi:MAG TPA: hypothetical protein VH300_01600, partial [Thermoleophilaceae bacterium]|nr:hypothetical protein [Thermoleophilaceae bacterium]